MYEEINHLYCRLRSFSSSILSLTLCSWSPTCKKMQIFDHVLRFCFHLTDYLKICQWQPQYPLWCSPTLGCSAASSSPSPLAPNHLSLFAPLLSPFVLSLKDFNFARFFLCPHLLLPPPLHHLQPELGSQVVARLQAPRFHSRLKRHHRERSAANCIGRTWSLSPFLVFNYCLWYCLQDLLDFPTSLVWSRALPDFTISSSSFASFSLLATFSCHSL